MPAIRCRQIIDSDVPEITALLARGFPSRDAQFWSNALAQLGARQSPAGLPQYGYLLESDNRPVGAILLVCAELRTAVTSVRRCNLSSWYVEPAFRSYAPLLVSRALAHKDVTFLNISAAPHTRPIIEAQGFLRYSDGVFVAVPALNGLFGSPGVAILDARTRPTVAFDPLEHDILLQHAELGCISLWCATSERAYPFVFRPRRVKTAVAVRATDLLPRCRRLRPLCWAAWPPTGAPRKSLCDYRRQRADARAVRPLSPWQHAEILQRSADAAPRRPRLHRICGARRLN